MSSIKTDVAVIGAGPVGLFSVFECGMMKMKCHVIDSLDMIGGQCAALYPEKPIYDIPACPEISAEKLVEQLHKQIEPFAPEFHLSQQVTGLEKLNDGWKVTTNKDTVIEAKAVFLAAGVGAFGPNRPPLEGIEKFEGQSVFYMVKKREDFRGKKIIIAGGGDSAVDWAVALADVAEKIYVVHRRPKFRAAPSMVEQMKALAESGKIELVVPYQLSSIEAGEEEAIAVNVSTLNGSETRCIEADVLLPFFGLSMNLGPILDWGLDLDEKHITVNPATCETNLPGVFAIGDISRYPGKLKLILTGFSEAAIAAHKARDLVFPGEVFHFEYSTTQGVPS